MFKISQDILSKKGLKLRYFSLSLVTSPLIGSVFYAHSSYSSPFFCPIKALTGIPCPSCGMTRSFVAIARGNIGEAINYHLFGIVIFSSLLIITIHLALEIGYKRKISTFFSQFLEKKDNIILILITFLIYYLIRLYNLGKSGQLMIDFHNSPLGNLIN